MSSWVAQPVVADLRTHQLDVHPGGQRVLGDAVVQLAGDAVALVVEHLALPRRAQLGLGGDELVVAGLEVGGLAGGARVQAGGVVEQRAVLQRRGRLTGEDAQHGVVGVLDLPLGRGPRGEPADDAPVEPDGHVQVVPCWWSSCVAVGEAGPDLSTWWRRARAVSAVGPRTRWRGRTSGSSPSTSANTTHSAERCSAAASTTARTSASEPSMVRTSAPEIRSSARMTRRSRSAEIRYSG